MHTKKSKNAAPQDVYSVDTSEWRPYAQGERTATTRNVHDDVDCVPESTTCACCAWTNTDRGRDALIAHYQCEWHIYNVKCRAKHKQPVSRRVFDSLTDDESSESLSDDDNDDDTVVAEKLPPHLGPFQLFTCNGNMYGVYRTMLTHCTLGTIASAKSIGVLMLAGGHFAGACFDGAGTVTVHRTFARYTVRAKQGGAQDVHDMHAGFNAHSAGASLRRHNAQALRIDIQTLLSEWRPLLAACTYIFMRCAPYQRSIFIDDSNKTLFNHDDSRIKTIPFVTRRPTFAECKRVHAQLTSVREYGAVDAFEIQLATDLKNMTVNSVAAAPRVRRDKHALPSRDDEESSNDEEQTTAPRLKPIVKLDDDALPAGDGTVLIGGVSISRTIVQQLYALVTKGDVDTLKSNYLSTDDKQLRNSSVVCLDQYRVGADKQSLLHRAAAGCHAAMVSALLHAGVDPTVRDVNGHVAYNVAGNKPTRRSFVQFRAQCTSADINWNQAQIPAATNDTASVIDDEAHERHLQKRREQKQRQKERDKQRRQEAAAVQADEAERERFLALTDREKRALAAERRALTGGVTLAASRCFQCALDITGKTPFEYNSNRFCSTSCVKAHRIAHTATN